MDEKIMRALGFNKEVDRRNQGECPLCGVKIDVKTFKDSKSFKEFTISGMCQACQDDIFEEQ